MADFASPVNAGAPHSVMDYANQQQQISDQSNLQGLQAVSGANDLQAKQRAMQLSMLTGVLNEQDPEKQRKLLGNLVPIANRINPSYQIDPNIDVPTIRALVQSQVSPEKQAELANQRMMYGAKANIIKTDPVTGSLIKVNRFTGEATPVTPEQAIQEQQQAAAPQDTGGIFPQPAQQQPSAPVQNTPAQQPAYGFPVSSFANDPNSLKLARANAAKYDANRQGRELAADNVLANVAVLEDQLAKVQGGSGLNKAGIAVKGLYGGDEARAAQDADANAKELALNLTSLNQSAQGGGSGRSTVVGLKTLLGSKPDPYSGYQENNLSNLNKIKGEVNKYKAETVFLDAYKEANPLHVIDENAHKLFESLAKKFPVLETKDGKFSYNENNQQALIDAIPDAIQNPYNYMGRNDAKAQADSGLKKTYDAQGQTPIDTPDAIGKAYQSGRITKEQAKELLSKHGIQ